MIDLFCMPYGPFYPFTGSDKGTFIFLLFLIIPIRFCKLFFELFPFRLLNETDHWKVIPYQIRYGVHDETSGDTWHTFVLCIILYFHITKVNNLIK